MYLSVLVNFCKPITQNGNALFKKCSPLVIVFFNISDLNFQLKRLLTIVNLKKTLTAVLLSHQYSVQF